MYVGIRKSKAQQIFAMKIIAVQAINTPAIGINSSKTALKSVF
jgi:hypothetical protein